MNLELCKIITFAMDYYEKLYIKKLDVKFTRVFSFELESVLGIFASRLHRAGKQN